MSRTRAALLLAALSLATLVTWSAWLAGPRHGGRCADPEALDDVLAIPGTLDAQDTAPSHRGDWFARKSGWLDTPSDISYRVVRSSQASLLFGNWVSTLEIPMDPDRVNKATLEVDGRPVPIRLARASLGRGTHVAALLAVHGAEPVGSLFWRQLALAPQQLLRGSLPLTLYVADGLVARGKEEAVEGPAREWLANAWRHHRDACAP